MKMCGVGKAKISHTGWFVMLKLQISSFDLRDFRESAGENHSSMNSNFLI